jgi:hypothetical protein
MKPQHGGCVLATLMLVIVAGCSTTPQMDTYVPARCHGLAEPFSTYNLEFIAVPGFIDEVIATSLRGALAAQSLDEVSADADITVLSSFFLIDRNPPIEEEDPFGEQVETGGINRFVTHLKVDVIDRRTEELIWTGAMYRPHAIQGGETFHDERAVLIIRQAFDEMFVGLTTPCE